MRVSTGMNRDPDTAAGHHARPYLLEGNGGGCGLLRVASRMMEYSDFTKPRCSCPGGRFAPYQKTVWMLNSHLRI